MKYLHTGMVTMDLFSIGSTAPSIASADMASTVGIAVLKKVMDIQAQSAAQLIQAIPQTMPANNPPNLGQGVDTFV
jgi:hypothetical protein